MKKIFSALTILSVIFLFTPFRANAVGGIAYDSTATGTTTGTSLTFSHTTSGTNRILFVYVQLNSTTDALTGVTYAGTSLTFINKNTDPTNGYWGYLYYMVAPATGTNNVVVSLSSSVLLWAYSASYTGASQTGQPDANITNTATTGTSITTSLTTVANNAWIVTGARNYAANVTSGTNFTVRSAAFPIAIGDTNAAITPAGATSVTANSGTSSDWQVLLASFSPAVSANPSILTSWITWIF